ncbi:hypothetical protein [Ralstonia sp.]|uniref:hypothetical protein n=1 Tax=Ralstonia sp. TaxID=54061 RepID=UPI0031DF6BA6
MRYYQAYSDFTAQEKSVSALYGMLALLEQDHRNTALLCPIVVFMAFSIESYVNTLGARAVPFWDAIERLQWRAKLEILHTTTGATPDWSRGPLQFASEVFRLRDRLAHGKPERVYGEKVLDGAEPWKMVFGEGLQPKWFKSITRDWVLDSRDRFRQMMTYLESLMGHDEGDHLLAATSSVLLVDEATTAPSDG